MNENDIKAAVAVIHTAKPKREFLLLKRNKDPRDPWSGNYAFPGGMREDSDDGLYMTSVRETEEECDVKLNKEMFRGELPIRTAGKVVGSLIHVQPFRFEVNEKPPCVVDEKEIVSAHWISEDIIKNQDMHCKEVLPLKKGDFETWGIHYEGTFLWGFTYKVLLQHLEIPILEGL
jgi:8-oxo-dGTP pyrophosphatase MutT (NUDIX family)